MPEAALLGLRRTQRERGIFLACRCVPTADLEAEPCEEALGRIDAEVVERTWLTEAVVRLRLACDVLPEYGAGQFVNLSLPGGIVRSYSLASVPRHDDHLELHIAILRRGRAGEWVRRRARAGVRVALAGPLGDCVYRGGEPDRPLLLAGTGTGLAPLYGISRAALVDGHRGAIHLFHGSVRSEGLYLDGDLRALASGRDNLHYHPSALDAGAPAGVSTTPLDRLIAERLPDLTGYRVYLCGAPDFVRTMQRKVFLAGASLGEIHADAFLPAGGGGAPGPGPRAGGPVGEPPVGEESHRSS